MKKQVIPTSGGRSRSIYENAVRRFGNSKGPVTPAYLRLESAALGTQSSVAFNLLKNEGGTPNQTEKRLAITDNFLATSIGFYLLKVTTAGTNYGDVLNSWPNSIEYSASNEATNLLNLYNGALQITINGEVELDSWDLMRHYRVPTAQKSVLTAASGTNNAYVESGWDTADYGMYPLTPQILLRGSSKNIIQINCPASAAMAGSSSTNYAVIVFRGFLMQNASNVVG